MTKELWQLDARRVTEGIRQGEFSTREMISACIERLEATHPALNAITEMRPEAALAAADAADKDRAAGNAQGPLTGVPVTIKGNVDLQGWATVNGCAALRDNVAPQSSPCVQNWVDAGAIVIGRTNTPEFCCRWETSNEVFGATRNPWNPACTPGGSSGGAAASLAVGVTPLAHGNDLGGSLRQPAQACGVASIRPTLGRVPCWTPTMPMEPGIGVQMMNAEGVMGRKVADVRMGLAAMAERDWHDPWWVPAPLQEKPSIAGPVALVVDPGAGVSQQVSAGVERAGRLLTDAGYDVEEVAPPGIEEAAWIWRVICVGELLTHLEPAVREICGPLLRRTFDHYRDALGKFDLDIYADAFAQRRRVFRDWLGFFERYPLIVAPVGTQPPLAPDADVASPQDTLAAIESFRMVVAVNALGLPAAVVPTGLGDGLPQVVQIIGPPFAEMQCLAAAEAIEQQVNPLTPIDPG